MRQERSRQGWSEWQLIFQSLHITHYTLHKYIISLYNLYDGFLVLVGWWVVHQQPPGWIDRNGENNCKIWNKVEKQNNEVSWLSKASPAIKSVVWMLKLCGETSVWLGGGRWSIKYKDHINQIGIYADNLATLPLLAQFYGSVLAFFPIHHIYYLIIS